MSKFFRSYQAKDRTPLEGVAGCMLQFGGCFRPTRCTTDEEHIMGVTGGSVTICGPGESLGTHGTLTIIIGEPRRVDAVREGPNGPTITVMLPALLAVGTELQRESLSREPRTWVVKRAAHAEPGLVELLLQRDAKPVVGEFFNIVADHDD